MTTKTYQQASERFLAQARQELSAGDLPQASEKGWGTAAQIVKAVAEQRGWEHGVHRQLFDAIDNLRAETGDLEIAHLFDVANALHTNFYEGRRSVQSIAVALDAVARFVDRLTPLLSPRGG